MANMLAPYQQTLVTLAVADAIRAVSGKWNGAMPTTLSGLWLFPSNWIENIASAAKSIGQPNQPVAK